MEKLNTERIDGEGKPIVFIHGWKTSLKNWRNLRDQLYLENPMIFYDQRCHGKSQCKNFNIEDLAKDLEKITQELETPVLVGHSMGGMTALKYSTVSENYSSLILLATCASRPETRYLSPKHLSKYILEDLKELIYEEKDKEPLKNHRKSDTPSLGALIYGLKAMTFYDVKKELKKEDALVVAGSRDRVIPPYQSRQTADILECKYQEIDSPHQMLKKKPEKVAEKIEEFLRK